MTALVLLRRTTNNGGTRFFGELSTKDMAYPLERPGVAWWKRDQSVNNNDVWAMNDGIKDAFGQTTLQAVWRHCHGMVFDFLSPINAEGALITYFTRCHDVDDIVNYTSELGNKGLADLKNMLHYTPFQIESVRLSLEQPF